MEISKEQFDSFINYVGNLRRIVEDLQTDMEILDAQTIALGNLLLKKKILTLEELTNYTSGVMGMKIAEKRKERTQGYLGKPLTKQEIEELLTMQGTEEK